MLTANKSAESDTFKVRADACGIKEGMSQSQMFSALASRSLAASTTLKEYSGCHAAELNDLTDALHIAGTEVVGGDMGRMERMLVSQAINLDAIFNSLAIRSSKQNSIKSIEAFMRLALKAQAQSRATAEALVEIKNPRPVTFVKQANMNQGNQQINNSYANTPSDDGTNSCAGNSQTKQNKLLEADHGQRMDFGAQAATSRGNQTVEAVVEVNRPTNP